MLSPHHHAPFAEQAHSCRGRAFAEASSPTRTEFQRDRDRIIHSTAFRRLAHKTQVFLPLEGDHFRTRLTHTIEVSQIARALARALKLDEDLAEAVALAHDLGHTPFGHTGEEVLKDLLREQGGFDHNAQALRLVTNLERRYANFDGLNLCWETLEGLVKHNGPLLGKAGDAKPVPRAILDFDAGHFQQHGGLKLNSFASLEAQAAALADDIAYNAHDLDDGLRAKLFTLDDLRDVDFLANLLDEILALHPHLEESRVIHELVRRVITRFVEDAIAESLRRLVKLKPQTADDVRAAAFACVAFSQPYDEAKNAIKIFLFPRMYRHPRVVSESALAERVVRGLYAYFIAHPQDMPEFWAQRAQTQTQAPRAVADYIAGMTDRYALAHYERLCAG